MEFIAANSELLIIIGLIAGVLAFGMGIIPYFQRKKYITIEGTKISQELLVIVKLLLAEVNFKDVKVKEQTVLILDIVKNIVAYIENNLEVTDVEQKKKIAYGLIIESLNDLNIEINDNRKKLIELTINEALK